MDTLDHAFFYNSNDGDRIYDADSFSEWLRKFFTTGVFTGDLQVTAGGGMTLSVGAGYCNINGKVKMWREPQSLTISPQSGSNNRIDSIVIERNDLDRDFTLKVARGTSAASPQAPAPVRSGSVYQIVLAQVTVKTGAIAISAADIRDTRAVSSLCGIVAGTVKEIDFDQIQTQFDAWFDRYKADFAAEYQSYQTQLQALLDQIRTTGQSNLSTLTKELTDFTAKQTTAFDSWFAGIKTQLSGDVAGNLQNQLSDLYGLVQETQEVSVEIPVSAWQIASGEYDFYQFRATVNVPAASASHFPVARVLPDYYEVARLAGLCDICECGAGTLSFLAARKPTGTIQMDILLIRNGELPPRVLYRREEKGLILDYYSDGDIQPVGENNPDASIFTFEGAVVSGNGDVSVDNKSISTLTIAVNNDYPTHAVGNGKKLVISWSGNDSATAKFPDARIRMAAPAPTETEIGFNLSSKRSKGMSLALTLYSCKRGASLGSVGTEWGQYTITPTNDGKAHHYRIPLTEFGVDEPITLGEDDTLELKIHWSNTAFTDASGDLVLIDNIGFFGASQTQTGVGALPIATKAQLGGVKLGDTITGTDDGTINVSAAVVTNQIMATDQDVTAMMGDVFGGQE